MNLRDRLRMMGVAAQARPTPGSGPGPTEDTDGAPAGALAPAALSPALPGFQRLDTPLGPVHRLDIAYPPDLCRGGAPLPGFLAVPPAGRRRLGRHPAWAGIDLARCAFFDTETTGLAGGTGTVIFLAGIGCLEGDRFILRQYFLEDYPAEAAFLQAITLDLGAAAAVVSFNGRAYDWPLLQTRCTLHRMPLPTVRHLDVLHPARRLWRGVAPSCSLMALETLALGEERQGDVPGHRIPDLYFDYLRSGNGTPLTAVFQHNRLDILSLAALTGWLGHALADPLRSAPTGQPLPPPLLAAAGRWLVQDGDLEAAVTVLTAALAGDLPRPMATACRRWLAVAHRRRHAHQASAQVWHRWAVEGGDHNPEPYVELAKFYEHRAADPGRAREMTLQALAALDRHQSRMRLAGVPATRPGLSGPARRDLSRAALLHRLQRLEAKLRKGSENGITPRSPA